MSRSTCDLATPAAIVAVLGASTLAAAWVLQSRGYSPCELCLRERVPFYAGGPLAAALAISPPRLPRAAQRIGFTLLTLTFAAETTLGAYHAGVEWHLWAGPTGCSGVLAAPADVVEFVKQHADVTIVYCDKAAIYIFGLSHAAWDALVCLGLAVTAALGWRHARG